MNKSQIFKIASRVSVVGAFGFMMHTIASLETQRREAEARANTFVGMFGSLATYVGDDTVLAWQEQISGEEDLEEMPEGDEDEEQLEDAIAKHEQLDRQVDDIEAGVDPVDAIEDQEHGTFVVDIPTAEVTNDPVEVLKNSTLPMPPADKDVIVDMSMVEKESAADGPAGQES